VPVVARLAPLSAGPGCPVLPGVTKCHPQGGQPARRGILGVTLPGHSAPSHCSSDDPACTSGPGHTGRPEAQPPSGRPRGTRNGMGRAQTWGPPGHGRSDTDRAVDGVPAEVWADRRTRAHTGAARGAQGGGQVTGAGGRGRAGEPWSGRIRRATMPVATGRLLAGFTPPPDCRMTGSSDEDPLAEWTMVILSGLIVARLWPFLHDFTPPHSECLTAGNKSGAVPRSSPVREQGEGGQSDYGRPESYRSARCRGPATVEKLPRVGTSFRCPCLATKLNAYPATATLSHYLE
jgi:hypothetical protein